MEEIFAYYIDQVGYDLASRIIDTMPEAIDSLLHNAQSLPKSHFSDNIHRLIIEKPPYSVYFCILEASQEVVILEVLHNKRDQNFLQTKYENL